MKEDFAFSGRSECPRLSWIGYSLLAIFVLPVGFEQLLYSFHPQFLSAFADIAPKLPYAKRLSILTEQPVAVILDAWVAIPGMACALLFWCAVWLRALRRTTLYTPSTIQMRSVVLVASLILLAFLFMLGDFDLINFPGLVSGRGFLDQPPTFPFIKFAKNHSWAIPILVAVYSCCVVFSYAIVFSVLIHPYKSILLLTGLKIARPQTKGEKCNE